MKIRSPKRWVRARQLTQVFFFLLFLLLLLLPSHKAAVEAVHRMVRVVPAIGFVERFEAVLHRLLFDRVAGVHRSVPLRRSATSWA